MNKPAKQPFKPRPVIFFTGLLFLLAALTWCFPKQPVSVEAASLPRVESKEKLLELLKQYQNQYKRYSPDMFVSGTDTAKASTVQNEAAPVPAPGQYSQTNTQVAGVDEADLVKTDGQYIYQVSGKRLLIVKAAPASDMELVSKITVADKNFTPLEIYVDNNYLILIGQLNEYNPIFEPYPLENGELYCPPAYSMSVTRAQVYDISDRSNPLKLREVDLEGCYLSSRKIGSSLYLVSNRYIHLYGIRNEETLLPHYRDSAGSQSMSSIGYDRICYFPGSIYPGYILVAGLNVADNSQAVQVESYLGNGENIYASASRLYVALSNYEHHPPAVAKDSAAPVDHHPESQTVIHAFDLNSGKVKYAAQGTVPGTIINQFSMDAYNGYFRIATTTGEVWRSDQPTSCNNIYVLDQGLNMVGRLEGIAPGEKIYSTRFMGNRAYMVTFRNVDPFFVIDMSNPQAPSILGKLKIPGYSDYLHPYDENHVIGFGKDTIVAKGSGGNDQAFYQGMKLALFDVSDVANPVEMSRQVIGDRGTDSELLNNHKALLFSRENNLLAFPVTVMEIEAKESSSSSSWPAYGSFTFQGAYVYQIDLQNGLLYRGRITHLSGDDYAKAGDYWYDSEKNIRRIIYIGDNLYTLSDGMIQAHNIVNLSLTGSVDLK